MNKNKWRGGKRYTWGRIGCQQENYKGKRKRNHNVCQYNWGEENLYPIQQRPYGSENNPWKFYKDKCYNTNSL